MKSDPSTPAVLLRPAATTRTAGWVLKRALIGIALLAMFAIGGSILLYATIEPDPAGISAE